VTARLRLIEEENLMDAASADRTSPVAHYIPNPADSSSVLVTAGFIVAGGQVPNLETYPVPAAEVASIVQADGDDQTDWIVEVQLELT
jgi:hypothetical protein